MGLIFFVELVRAYLFIYFCIFIPSVSFDPDTAAAALRSGGVGGLAGQLPAAGQGHAFCSSGHDETRGPGVALSTCASIKPIVLVPKKKKEHKHAQRRPAENNRAAF